MGNFWQKLNKPFTVLAPMDDVTDEVFRQVVVKMGRPDVFFTEFTNVDGLYSKGREALLPRLNFSKNEHPIVAQIWGLKPENYFKAAQEIAEMGFDGIDINMGCPEKNVRKNGACSALMRNRPLAKELIEATKKGAKGLSVSIKTRLGMFKIETEDWLGFLLDQDLDALIIHGRTVSEMSKVPAHWDEIEKAVKMRDLKNLKTVIVGNGDVESYQEALGKCDQFGVDGVMIGRGIFKDIQVFSGKSKVLSVKERLELLIWHTKLFTKTFGNKKNFAILKKFYKIYASDFEGAAELRAKLMEANDEEEVREIIDDFRTDYDSKVV